MISSIGYIVCLLVCRFPVSEYPVIALMGAPGSFPVHEKDRWLQKFVQWSVKIEKKAKEFITSMLQNEPFVGIHLRNGIDFVSIVEVGAGAGFAF